MHIDDNNLNNLYDKVRKKKLTQVCFYANADDLNYIKSLQNVVKDLTDDTLSYTDVMRFILHIVKPLKVPDVIKQYDLFKCKK